MSARPLFGLAVAGLLAASAAVVGVAEQDPQRSAPASEQPSACSALTGRTFDNGTSIASAALVTSGELRISDTVSARTLPPFCRVQGVSKPSADSDIRFEVWLPQPAAWNGKFLSTGEGGFAGQLN